MTDANDDGQDCHGHAHATVAISCPQLIDLITDYVEAQLPEKTRAALEDHLDLCPPCQEFLASYRGASESCRQALLERVPDGLEARLMSFLRKRCRR